MRGIVLSAAIAVVCLPIWAADVKDNINTDDIIKKFAAKEAEFAEARNSLGVAYLRQGRVADAVAQLREAVRLRPDLEAARRNLEDALGRP